MSDEIEGAISNDPNDEHIPGPIKWVGSSYPRDSGLSMRDWFAAGAFAVGAGSNLCPKELAAQGRFTEITEIARKFALAVQAARTS